MASRSALLLEYRPTRSFVRTRSRSSWGRDSRGDISQVLNSVTKECVQRWKMDRSKPLVVHLVELFRALTSCSLVPAGNHDEVLLFCQLARDPNVLNIRKEMISC